MARKSFWTPENVKRLEALVSRGQLIVTYEDAAKLLGTSTSTVQAEAVKRGFTALGREHDRWTPHLLAKLKLLTDEHGKLRLSRTKAAKVLGCDRHSLITGLLLLEGTTPAKLSPHAISRLKKLADGDRRLTLSINAAAAKLKCTVKVLKTAMRKHAIRPQATFSWTPNKLDILRDLTDSDGKLRITQKTAIAKLGCSHRALQERLSLPPDRKWQPKTIMPLPATRPKRQRPKHRHPELRALCKDGLLTIPTAEAAKRLNVSEATIARRLKLIGARPLPRAVPPQLATYRQRRHATTRERREALKKMAPRGVLPFHPNEAASRLGCRPGTIIADMHALHIRTTDTPPAAAWTPEKEAALRAMAARRRLTIPVAAASARLGIAPQDLEPHLTRLGLMHMANPAFKTDVGPILALLRRWIPRLTPMEASDAVKALPALAHLTGEQLALRIGALSRAFKADEHAALQMALSAPALFTRDIPDIRSTLRAATQVFHLTPSTFPATVRRIPHAWTLSPELFLQKIDMLAVFLEIDRQEVLVFLKRQPILITHDRTSLEAIAEDLCEALSVPVESIRAVMRRHINLIHARPSKLADHCAQAAALLGITPAAVTKAFLASPSLLLVKTETLDSNVSLGAKLLNCQKPALAAAYLRRPALLTMKPTTIAQRVADLSAIFNVSKSRMTDIALDNPYLLTFATENTREKAWLLTKLAQALKSGEDLPAILKTAPKAFTYAKQRIAARIELAREGIGPKSITGMLFLSDAKAAELSARGTSPSA